MKAGRPERTNRDSGPTQLRWRSKTKRENCKASPEWCAILANAMAHEEWLRLGACTPYEKEMNARTASVFRSWSPRRYGAGWSIWRGKNLRSQRRKWCSSAVLKRILRQAEAVAPTDATVLTLGRNWWREPSSESPRKHLPFVTLNCAACLPACSKASLRAPLAALRQDALEFAGSATLEQVERSTSYGCFVSEAAWSPRPPPVSDCTGPCSMP